MNKRLLLSMAAACALAVAPLAAHAAGCKMNCSIDVEVSDSGTNSCTITKPAKTHEFNVAADTTTDVTWTIKNSPGYEFTADGVKFKGNPPAGTFTKKNAGNKQEFVYTDANDAPAKKGKHPYKISVQKGTTRTCDLDPSVVNE